MLSIFCFKEVDYLVSDIIKQIITNIHSIEYYCFTVILHLHFAVHSKLKSYAIHLQNDSLTHKESVEMTFVYQVESCGKTCNNNKRCDTPHLNSMGYTHNSA